MSRKSTADRTARRPKRLARKLRRRAAHLAAASPAPAIEPLEPRLLLSGEGLLGDFNANGTLDAADLDLLRNNPGLDSPYDLDGDGDNDADDLAFALPNVYATGLGDANLDRSIDAADLAIVDANLGQPGGWGEGDVDGDGLVTQADRDATVAALGTRFLPADVYQLLDGRLDAPFFDWVEPTPVDASTTALHAEFDSYFNATNEDIWRANLNGDDVVDAADRAIFDNAVAGYPDAGLPGSLPGALPGSLPGVVAIAVPDGTHSFSVVYDDAALVDEVYGDWIEPLFTRYGLSYDPADDPAYADLLDEHVPTFRYANLAHTTWGKGLAFLGEAYRTDGPPDATEVPELETRSPVVINNLGVYDPETGAYVDSSWAGGDATTVPATSPGFSLGGRYSRTGQMTLLPQLEGFRSLAQDFRVALESMTAASNPAAVNWSTQTNMYYHVDRFRSDFADDAFVTSLDLPPDIEANITVRQYRDSGFGPGVEHNRDNPRLRSEEGFSLSTTLGISIEPVINVVTFGSRSRRPPDLAGDLPIVSHGFDRGAVVGEYAGLFPFWLSPVNDLYPPDGLFDNQHPGSMTAVINDSFNNWASYRYTGESELWRTIYANLRLWAGRPVGGEEGIPALRGKEIGELNSMMFDENDTSGDQIYPYKNELPGGLTQDDYPDGGDRAGLFLAALWYEMANDGGLGAEKVDMIVWKTLSMIPDVQTFTMRQFGDLMLTAAAELWPDSTDPTRSVYHDLLVQVMASRGIAVYGVSDFRDNLPARVGDAGTLDVQTTSAFGTTHPDRQADMSLSTWNYDNKRIFRNGYTAPDSDFDYMTYSFYKHSKYGPGDKVLFSDGSFSGPEDFTDQQLAENNDPFGEWREDGSYQIQLEGREAGNVTLFTPGNEVDWVRHRNRLPNEAAGPSTIDMHSFGWIATQSMKNGFSIETRRIGSDAATITYEVSIVDPSLDLTGGLRTGPAEYDWSFSDYLGNSVSVDGSQRSDGGQVVRYTALRDEPFDLSITRTRNGIVDTLELTERGNDFDRDGGKAFAVSAVDLPTVTVDPLTSATDRPGVTGTVSDPGAVVEVWVQTDPSQTYQTAEVYTATNHGDGTWSFPAGAIEPLPEGTWDVRVRATIDGKLSVVDQTDAELTVTEALPASVVGRHVFFNASAFDGADPGATPADDAAIATEKQPLLPGETADFTNYTSYDKGINGIMIDVADLAALGSIDASDFVLTTGNDATPGDWAPVSGSMDVSVREGKGVNGTDRITLVLPDGEVVGEWLRVEMLANVDTGLAESDVFYFGNAIGDSGDATTNTNVDATDELGARNNQHNFLDPAPIDDAYDYNRDARVDATDELLARNNQTNFLNRLNLITVPDVGTTTTVNSASQPLVAGSDVTQQPVSFEEWNTLGTDAAIAGVVELTATQAAIRRAADAGDVATVGLWRDFDLGVDDNTSIGFDLQLDSPDLIFEPNAADQGYAGVSLQLSTPEGPRELRLSFSSGDENARTADPDVYQVSRTGISGGQWLTGLDYRIRDYLPTATALERIELFGFGSSFEIGSLG